MIFDKLKIEFFGTFLTTFCTGVLLFQVHLKIISINSLAIGMFVIYSLVIWAAKCISGAQINSVITMSLMFSKHVKFTHGLIILSVQLAASIFAITLVKFCFPVTFSFNIQRDTWMGFPKNDKEGDLNKLIIEIIGTFFVVFAHYMLVIEKTAPKFCYGSGMAGIYAGITLFAINKSGAGLNFVRMFAYSFVGNHNTNLMVYVVGSIAGGLFGGYFGNLLLSEKAEISKLKKQEAKRKKHLKQVKEA